MSIQGLLYCLKMRFSIEMEMKNTKKCRLIKVLYKGVPGPLEGQYKQHLQHTLEQRTYKRKKRRQRCYCELVSLIIFLKEDQEEKFMVQ